MRRIQRLLEERIGLDVGSIGSSAIEAAVRSRLQAGAAPDVEGYAATLRGNEEEIHALIEAIVVSETWFMRDREPFEHLGRLALRGVDPESPLRILSAPCATGEEPYSIAIRLTRMGLAGRFAVEGIDISQRAIAVARQATYGERSFRDECEPWRSEFFERDRDRFRLSGTIAATVTLRAGNLLDGTTLRGLQYHVVFCRNLLIYLGASARKTVLDSLERCLLPGGTLFVGHAEALSRMDPRFVRVGPNGAFAYQRAADLPRSSRSPATATARPRLPRPIRAIVPAGTRPRLSAPPPRPSGAPRVSFLEQARMLADRGDMPLARAACEESLAKEGKTAAAYALLGAILSATGATREAEASFERALYLDPSHHEALIHLTALCDGRGDQGGAARYRARAERVARREAAKP